MAQVAQVALYVCSFCRRDTHGFTPMKRHLRHLRHLILQRRRFSLRTMARSRTKPRQPAQPRRLITILYAVLQSLSRTTDTAVLASQGPDWPLPSLTRAGPKVSWLEGFGLVTAAAAQVRSSKTNGTAARVGNRLGRAALGLAWS